MMTTDNESTNEDNAIIFTAGEERQILQDQYDSALIKVAKAEAKIGEIKRHKQYLNTLHGEYLDEMTKALDDQRELLQAILEEKEKEVKL